VAQRLLAAGPTAVLGEITMSAARAGSDVSAWWGAEVVEAEGFEGASLGCRWEVAFAAAGLLVLSLAYVRAAVGRHRAALAAIAAPLVSPAAAVAAALFAPSKLKLAPLGAFIIGGRAVHSLL
jgi:hypothetical protein